MLILCIFDRVVVRGAGTIFTGKLIYDN
jgi:hypothetical protein